MTTDALLTAVAEWKAGSKTEREPTLAELFPGRPDLHPQAASLLGKLRRVGQLRDHLAASNPDATAEADAPLDPPVAGGDLGAVGGLYRILRVLGEGGMGVVYEAETADPHPRPGLRVAVKLLRTAGPAADEYLREAKAAVDSRHHHVVPVYEVGRHRDRPYLVMPRLTGETLEQRLRREPRCDLGFILQVGRHIAAGLTAVHAAGYVHRDVKPSNLWLEGWHDYLRVLDFGLARPAADAPAAVCGTPGYMAPEQMVGGRVDGRADLFGLGCVLYRMATGLPAFGGATPVAVLNAIRTHRPVAVARLRPDLPAALCELIHAMLSIDPAGRPADVWAVRAVLAELDSAARRAAAAMPVRRTTGWLRYLGLEKSRHAITPV